MDEKDIHIIQDSKIAVQTVSKMMATDKGFNFIYIDNRQSNVDNRSLHNEQQKLSNPAINRGSSAFPSFQVQDTGKIPENLINELEDIVRKFPTPILPCLMKALFIIAGKQGRDTDGKRGKFLGISKRKVNYWRNKLNLLGEKQ